MRIGELAELSGLTTHTLRYYEKQGLLSASDRNQSNYRVYSADDLASAKFIKHATSMGFSLSDVEQFLSIRADKPAHVCAEAKELAEKKIGELTTKIEDLQTMLDALHRLSDACCGGTENAEHCSIIKALDAAE